MPSETQCVLRCRVQPIDSLTYSRHDPGFPAYLFPSTVYYTNKKEKKTSVSLSSDPSLRCISTTPTSLFFFFSFPSVSILSTYLSSVNTTPASSTCASSRLNRILQRRTGYRQNATKIILTLINISLC